MSRGVVLIARNNSSVDYTKQAYWLAFRIRKYLDLPTTLITDNVAYLEKHFTDHIFDNVIEIPNENNYTHKGYKDGMYARQTLEFKNTARCNVYELSPYDETLVMDTDFIVSNDVLKNCFEQKNDLMLYKNAVELSNWRDLSEFDRISENSVDFYWATVIFFRKTSVNKTFFDLVKHIQENYYHYKNLYQLKGTTFRNDFAFSIAIHIMNGHSAGNFVVELPGTMYYITDRDQLVELKDTTFKFLVEKQDSSGYFPVIIKDSNVHVINKFSLNRIIDEQHS